MGVRGLTTYIGNNHRKYLKNFKLHDCYVIIDGNSLAYQVCTHFYSLSRGAFGGDYDRYAQKVKEIFSVLAVCNIKPIVLFDGGYEPKKVNTVIKRMTDRVRAINHITPSSHSAVALFPLLMKVVFKQVLKEMNIPYFQCDFEADQEIASLARKYDCPVLSFDSDFFIFDVNYIPIPTIEFEAKPLEFKFGEPSGKFCVHCKLYKVDYFLDSFGGLDKSLLPLLAALLGNDYIQMSVFKKFYSQLKIPKGNSNALQRRVARVIEWLRNETFDSAVDKILGRVKARQRRFLINKIKKILSAYTDCVIKTEKYLPFQFLNERQVVQSSNINKVNCSSLMIEKSNNEDEMDIDDIDYEVSNENSLSESDDDDNDDDNGNDEDTLEETLNVDDEMDVEMTEQLNLIKEMASKNKFKIPDWLLESSRKGNIEPCVFDILTLRTYFAIPQVESKSFASSHFTSVHLLKTICRILLGNNFDNISLWAKNGDGKVQRFLLHFSDMKIVTDIENIPKLHNDAKIVLLLESLNIPNDFSIDYFPDEWKLYICSVLFWMKNCSHPPVTESHVISVCMCMIALYIIDNKVGFFRKKQSFFKKHSKTLKKLMRGNTWEEEGIEDDKEENDLRNKNADEGNNEHSSQTSTENRTSSTIKEIMSAITTEDCIVSFEGFYNFHMLDESLNIDQKKYSTKDIHIFAQFQSCVHHSMLLNSLLDFPLLQPEIARLYSGTFLYNFCMQVNNSKNVSDFLEYILQHSPKIFNLFKKLFTTLTSAVPVAVIQPSRKRSQRRHKRKRSKRCLHESDDEVVEKKEREENDDDDAEGNSYYDENNAFSILSLV